MSIALKVENLSKAYQLGEIGTGTISRDFERWVARMRGKEDPFLRIGETNDRTKKGDSNIVWSLKDINFEINQGDAVGIIGRNGAGKSTLLKLLSRVTAPTTGSMKIKGRVASLLEVGTGFHPELTGRENVYLNGAILGMRKKEITRKFDEIVDFSGVERYIDTPVKRYSSGMYVRLAFAVAAHLESEILIVDEVLAVGDAEFQKKCLGKMGDISKGEGRTVLFVSHNMASIQNLCKNSILLSKGEVVGIDETPNIVNLYLTNLSEQLSTIPLIDRTDRVGGMNYKFVNLTVNNGNAVISGEPLCFEFEIQKVLPLISENIEIAISIVKIDGTLITVLSNRYINHELENTNGNVLKVNYKIEKLPLMSGEFKCNIMLKNNEDVEDWVQEAIIFKVESGDFYGTGNLIPNSHNSILFNYSIY